MPRARRGGRRQGQPGTAYQNRQDLNQAPRAQPIRVATGQPYGQAGEQADAQRAMPLPQVSAPPLPATGPAPGLEATPPGPFDRPTERPDEPLTAGVPIGPGPGPEVIPGQLDPVLAQLRAAYQLWPNEDLRKLLAEEEGRTNG